MSETPQTGQSPTLAIFTPAQRRAIELLALGWDAVAIARMVGSTAWTVRTHLAHAGKRLPESFYPDLTGAHNAKARLLMWYALSVQSAQLSLSDLAA